MRTMSVKGSLFLTTHGSFGAMCANAHTACTFRLTADQFGVAPDHTPHPTQKETRRKKEEETNRKREGGKQERGKEEKRKNEEERRRKRKNER